MAVNVRKLPISYDWVVSPVSRQTSPINSLGKNGGAAAVFVGGNVMTWRFG